ncbi:hypothetical protein, partial [Helcococcus ovis]|uniref:hypothetical protein n=1 Tax=Helcococcus ovis TaxID=72026 RepID=UPI001AD97654
MQNKRLIIIILTKMTLSKKYKYAGTILFGFGTLFMGMNIMGEAVKPLAKNVAFTSLLARS